MTTLLALASVLGGVFSGSVALLANGIHHLVELVAFLARGNFRFGQHYLPKVKKSELWVSIVMLVLYASTAIVLLNYGISLMQKEHSLRLFWMLFVSWGLLFGHYVVAHFLSSGQEKAVDHAFLYQRSVIHVVSSFLLIAVSALVYVTDWAIADIVLGLGMAVFMFIQIAVYTRELLINVLEKKKEQLDPVEIATVLCSHSEVLEAFNLLPEMQGNKRILKCSLTLKPEAFINVMQLKTELSRDMRRLFEIDRLMITFYFDARFEGESKRIQFYETQLN